MKKIPNIFKPEINHKINNNRNVYYSFIEEEVNNTSNERKTEDVVEKINRLIKENSYIFNKQVLIKTKEREYLTKIAGKMQNKIITVDGHSINIDDIIAIEEK